MIVSKPDSAVKTYNQRLFVGCGLLLLILLFTVAFGLVSFITQDRQQAQYPGSVSLSAHSNYKGLPRSYRWDDSFRTNDEFRAVYEWYSLKFNMGAESRANGSCILLEADDQYFRAERFISVFICGTPEGQLVYVSRTTTFK
jgi:hypothetical protein